MLIAVLSKRVQLDLADFDVFVNVVGGIRLSEPACDLGVAIAVVSSFRDAPTRNDLVWVGEVGLAGEVRSVNHFDKRMAEVGELGFAGLIGAGSNGSSRGVRHIEAKTLDQAIEHSF